MFWIYLDFLNFIKSRSFMLRLFVKIHTVILQPAKNLNLKDVILSEAKNLMFFLSKNQKRDPSDFALRMIRKGKFTKIFTAPSVLRFTYKYHLILFSVIFTFPSISIRYGTSSFLFMYIVILFVLLFCGSNM